MNYLLTLPKELRMLVDCYVNYNNWLFVSELFEHCLHITLGCSASYNGLKTQYLTILDALDLIYTMEEIVSTHIKGGYIVSQMTYKPKLAHPQTVTYEKVIKAVKTCLMKSMRPLIEDPLATYGLINELLIKYNFDIRIVELLLVNQYGPQYLLIHDKQIID